MKDKVSVLRLSKQPSEQTKSNGKKSVPKQTKSKDSDLFGSPEWKEISDSVARKLAGKLNHSQDNPYNTIHVDVDYYWDVEKTVLSLLEQFVGGYVWACKHDETFVAQHHEAAELQHLYDSLVAYRECLADPKRDAEEWYGQRFVAWSLIKLATILPSMWD